MTFGMRKSNEGDTIETQTKEVTRGSSDVCYDTVEGVSTKYDSPVHVLPKRMRLLPATSWCQHRAVFHC